jgi:hypothetical protein
MTQSTHPNSKVVTIFRILPFHARSQKDLTDYYNAASYAIGSYYKSVQSKVIATGLSEAELQLLMPAMIGLHPSDKDFRKELMNYFSDLNTKVPPTGLPLQIGLEVDNTKPVSAENLPIDVEQYIIYKHALGFPELALSKEVANGDPTKLCYLFDPEREGNTEIKENELLNEAMSHYLTIAKDAKKVAIQLTLLGKDADAIPKNKQSAELRKLVNLDPKRFLDLVQDESINFRYFLTELVKAKILQKVGARYVDSETNKQVGVNEKDAVLWLQDAENKKTVELFKIRLKEHSKEAV